MCSLPLITSPPSLPLSPSHYPVEDIQHPGISSDGGKSYPVQVAQKRCIQVHTLSTHHCPLIPGFQPLKLRSRHPTAYDTAGVTLPESPRRKILIQYRYLMQVKLCRFPGVTWRRPSDIYCQTRRRCIYILHRKGLARGDQAQRSLGAPIGGLW